MPQSRDCGLGNHGDTRADCIAEVNLDESFARAFLTDTGKILDRIETDTIRDVVAELVRLREQGGRLFFIGSGGGAAHASHAVNDFRKIAGIEAYTPSDNVAELTARVNDDGWESSYVNWLIGSRLTRDDLLFVFSVGGGDRCRGVSVNLVRCLEHAREVGARICGIVGRDGGYTAEVADACVVIPVVNESTVTAQTEGMQAVLWHLIVSHPALQINAGKWESIDS